MGSLSPIHWFLVAIVVLLVFGPKTLSKMGKSVGQSMRSVNKVKDSLTVDPLKALTSPAPAKKRPSPAPASEAPPAAEKAPEAAVASNDAPAPTAEAEKS